MESVNLASAVASAWPADITSLPLLITSKHLATLRGTTERTVERERCDGSGIPFIKWGRRVFYRRDDVLAFLGERTFSSTAEAKLAAASSAISAPPEKMPPEKSAKRGSESAGGQEKSQADKSSRTRAARPRTAHARSTAKNQSVA